MVPHSSTLTTIDTTRVSDAKTISASHKSEMFHCSFASVHPMSFQVVLPDVNDRLSLYFLF